MCLCSVCVTGDVLWETDVTAGVDLVLFYLLRPVMNDAVVHRVLNKTCFVTDVRNTKKGHMAHL